MGYLVFVLRLLPGRLLLVAFLKAHDGPALTASSMAAYRLLPPAVIAQSACSSSTSRCSWEPSLTQGVGDRRVGPRNVTPSLSQIGRKPRLIRLESSSEGCAAFHPMSEFFLFPA
jgi:hypothetical protein